MKEEAEHNRYFGETGVGLPDLAIYNEFGHGVFFEGDRVEDWNLGHLNNISAKNALRLEASVVTELYVQDFDESANHMGVSFDSQNALLAVKENTGIEFNNSFNLGVDEKLIVDDLDLASVPLVEENRGLGLEEIGLTTEAFFKGFNTTNPNLLTPDALKFEDTLSIDNSIENAGLVSLKESPEWYEAGIHNSLFANGSVLADLNTDCLTQPGVLSRDNVTGLGVVSFEYQSDLLRNGFIAEENSFQLIGSEESLVNADARFSLNHQESIQNGGLISKNEFHGTRNFHYLERNVPNNFSNINPREFLEWVLGISVYENEKKIELNFYFIENNGVVKNNNFFLNEVTLTSLDEEI